MSPEIQAEEVRFNPPVTLADSAEAERTLFKLDSPGSLHWVEVYGPVSNVASLTILVRGPRGSLHKARAERTVQFGDDLGREGMHLSGDGWTFGHCPKRGQALSVRFEDPIPVQELAISVCGGAFDLAALRWGRGATLTCPFRGSGQNIALSDLPAILRMGDRTRFHLAVDQLVSAVATTAELDEARGQILTMLAIIAATSLEFGGGRTLHRHQLDAARTLDRLADLREIAEFARNTCFELAGPLLAPAPSTQDELIELALQTVQRFYAKPLTDASLADRLGLSTSHFRHLFKRRTGLPFHRYLVQFRLEKAKELLSKGQGSVSEVAHRTGFTSLGHFSKCFSARFNVAPSEVRAIRQI
jgi:AraC-like DNA-binding protein